jgi:hypothetical protein
MARMSKVVSDLAWRPFEGGQLTQRFRARPSRSDRRWVW